MISIASRASRALVYAMVLPLLVASATANGAATRKTRATKPVAVKANTTIIALPLTPIVPAGQRVCAARTPSGLGYTMLRSATGTKPAEADVVLVNYIGYLATTGVVFDQGMRSPLSVNGVIPGFAQGIQMMARSGVVRLCIPAAMGYGARQSGPIPANSDLVFQVELVDFKTAAQVESMNKAEAGTTGEKDPATLP